MRKRIQWLFLAAALLSFMPSVAQDESVVTLAGNAYVTATSEGGDSKNVYIDEHNCALRNWDSTEDVVSFYFKVEKSGKMNVALQAKGDSKIEVTVLGKKKKIRLDCDDLSRVEVGTFKVKSPGYVKMDIRGLKINNGAGFGNVSAVLVSGDAAPVVCVAPDFSTHFGRRGPSVHMGYALPKENIEWFYNEVVVPEEGDIPSSYYMACGFGQGYFGMQNNRSFW